MSGNHLDAPLFIKAIRETAANAVATPSFYNNSGTPTYLSELPSGLTPLTPATTHPAMAMGHEYLVRPVRTLNQGIFA